MIKQCVNELDLVCSMVLKDCKAVETDEFGGKTYGFCSTKCKDLFHGNPQKYIENPASHECKPSRRDVPEKH